MIKYYVSLAFTFISLSLFSQEKLKIEYEMYVKMDTEGVKVFVDGGGISQQQIEKAVKEAGERPSYYDLTVSPNESIFEYKEKVDNQQNEEQSSFFISFGPRGKYYKNLKETLSLQESNSWNKDFVIKDSLKNYNWNITRKSKEILGYEVRKATSTLDSAAITAWYAPKLTFKNGPENFWGLPGLILEIENIQNTGDGGKQIQTYQAISLNVASEKDKIERPKKGKVLSTKEFDEFNQEQIKKMQDMYGGGVEKD